MSDQSTPPNAPASGSMSDAARERVQREIADGRDDTNPTFLYSATNTSLVVAITDGLIDPILLARRELASRGLDGDGQWVGFDRAEEIHGVQR